MNVLIIGNGFDLAHGLKTKYTDFLELVRILKEHSNLRNSPPNQRYFAQSNDNVLKDLDFLHDSNNYTKEFIRLSVEPNFWIYYFTHSVSKKQEKWIDFENEISEFIQLLQSDLKEQSMQSYLSSDKLYAFDDYIKEADFDLTEMSEYTHQKVHDMLLLDLNKLIRCFELYLELEVKKKEIHNISPDIATIKFNYVLSFNYTSTYSSIYNNTVPCEHIHGKSNLNNTIDSNNMVLGINEFLDDNTKNRHIEYIEFKKFYQCIHKMTGSLYWDLLNEINLNSANYNELSEVYIFGHSLDPTDGEILKQFLLNENIICNIYYRNKQQLSEQIINLVKIIGQDELIRQTGGIKKRLNFILQREFIPKQQ